MGYATVVRSLQAWESRFLTVAAPDLTASNILHRVSGLDGLSEDMVLSILGKPSLNTICDPESGTNKHSNPSAPEYLVYPVDWCRVVDRNIISSKPCIVDFGESYMATNHQKSLGSPGLTARQSSFLSPRPGMAQISGP